MSTALLDTYAPRPDFILAESSVVRIPADALYRAIGELRATDVRSPLVRTLAHARSLPETLHGHEHVPDLGETMLGERCAFLGERPGQEMVLGAAGRFWTAVPEWYDVTAESFREFAHPHSGTIALGFSVTPLAKMGCRLSIETRITVADPASRHAIALYWHAIRPAAWFITRKMLDAIAAHAVALTGR